MVVENGVGVRDEITEDGYIHDADRIDHIREHIKVRADAVDDHVDLIGYTPWGCVDLVSASTEEMVKHYGFIYVSRYDDGGGDPSRIPKDSFYWYKKVITSNGKDLN